MIVVLTEMVSGVIFNVIQQFCQNSVFSAPIACYIGKPQNLYYIALYNVHVCTHIHKIHAHTSIYTSILCISPLQVHRHVHCTCYAYPCSHCSSVYISTSERVTMYIYNRVLMHVYRCPVFTRLGQSNNDDSPAIATICLPGNSTIQRSLPPIYMHNL